MAKDYAPQQHQAHISVIKLALARHKVSYNQFAPFMKSDEYPFKGPDGTRKQRLQATSDVIRDYPDVFHQLMQDSGMSKSPQQDQNQ